MTQLQLGYVLGAAVAGGSIVAVTVGGRIAEGQHAPLVVPWLIACAVVLIATDWFLRLSGAWRTTRTLAASVAVLVLTGPVGIATLPWWASATVGAVAVAWLLLQVRAIRTEAQP